MEENGFFNKVGKNISDNINSISSGFENKKALNDKRNEKDRIYKYIGMEAFNLYKEGKMPSSELDVHFERLKTVDMEIARLEKEIEKSKSKGKVNCRNCGMELTSDVKYCPRCGAPVMQGGQSQQGQMPPYGAGQPGMNYGAPQTDMNNYGQPTPDMNTYGQPTQPGMGGGFDPYTAGQPMPDMNASAQPVPDMNTSAQPTPDMNSSGQPTPDMNTYGQLGTNGGFDPYTAGQSTLPGMGGGYNPGQNAAPDNNAYGAWQTGTNSSGQPDINSYNPYDAVPKTNIQPNSGTFTPNSYSQGTAQSVPQGMMPGANGGYDPYTAGQPTQPGAQTGMMSGYEQATQQGMAQGAQQTVAQSAPVGKTCVCGAIIPPGNTICMQCGRKADVI